ncbi:MAG: hypothetical protein K6B74_03005 [Ruminococcus sp.]|nr:hypothetical protein [Ruminococcus sp.]
MDTHKVLKRISAGLLALILASGAFSAEIADNGFADGLAVAASAAETETKASELVRIKAKAPTCTQDGNCEYWYDPVSDRRYSDENGENEITKAQTVIEATDHNYGEPVFRSSRTPKGTWYISIYFNCSACENVLYGTLPAECTVISEPTVNAEGLVSLTADFKGEVGKYTMEAVIPKLSVTKYNALKPTCTDDGNIEFYIDENRTIYVLEGDTFVEYDGDVGIPATGHSYNEPVWSWSDDLTSATAKFTCEKCGKTETVKAAVAINDRPVTCTENGETVYTATVEFEGKTYTDVIKTGIAANGHSYNDSYDEPVWSWSDDLTSATAKFTCKYCGDEQTAEAVIFKKAVSPTYTSEGKTVYTASVTLNGKTYTDVKEVKIDKLPYTAPKITWQAGEGMVKLTWTAVENAEKYAVYEYVGGKWQALGQGTGTSFDIKNLKPGTNHGVAVIAKVGGKWVNDVSNAVTVSPKGEKMRPYPVVKSQTCKNRFRLKWSAVEDAEKYGLAVYQSGKWVPKVQFGADVTEYTSPSMKKGEYKLLVAAKVGGKWILDNADSRAVTVSPG